MVVHVEIFLEDLTFPEAKHRLTGRLDGGIQASTRLICRTGLQELVLGP